MLRKNKLWLLCLATLLLVSKGFAQTQEIKGLTVIVEFLDAPFPESIDSVSKMMNQVGFSGWGNQGSVRDFFYTQSNGKVLITSTVIKVSLPHTKAYYYVDRLGGDLSDIIDGINQQYPSGFQNLTLKPDNSLKHFNVLTKAGGGAWAFGPQPGSNTIKNNGQNVYVFTGNITNYDIGQKPEYSTICHEMGHNVMEWPDHYQTSWANLGNYCQMATGGNHISPQMFNPALRLQKGWINAVEIGNKTYNETITATSNSYTTVYQYKNPSNPKEYLLVYPHVYGTYYKERVHNYGVADQGLAIYYVDEDGGMELAGEEDDWFVKLLQADNLDELNDEALGYGVEVSGGLGYTNISGDYDDLYDNVKNSFPAGTPFRWKDGGEFGLILSNISAPGATMTFTVVARTNTYIASSDKNGTISPKGVINSSNQTFTFTPNIGYEVNAVKVNGTTVTVTNNQYTLTGTGTKTIEVTFKRKSTQNALPSPWVKADVGTTASVGFAAHETGKFYVETYGDSISRTADNFTFLYQTLNGDGSIIAHVGDHNNPRRRKTKIGLMLRASLQSNSVQSMIAKVPYSGIWVEQRTSTGDYLVTDPNRFGALHTYELYSWLKITRVGNEIVSFCSLDGVSWKIIGVQNVNLPSQIYVGLCVTGAKEGYPARAVFDNVQVVSLPCTFTGAKISGSSIGNSGSYGGNGSTRDKAYDNNILTYYDADAAHNTAWTGLSLSSDYVVSGIRYFPREGFSDRMVDGKFQGSNTADFSSGVVDLAVISTEPKYDWNCITVSNTSSFRYVRYISPENGYGNVAEIGFYGSLAVVNPPPSVNLTSPLTNASFVAPATINISANASDANGSVSKVEFFNGSILLATDYTSPYSYSWTNVPVGTYTIKARATDNAGAYTDHTVSNITVSTTVANITGPACGNNNSTLLYEVSAANRVNANNFNWWFNGSAQGISSVSNASYQANLSTGNNFGAGQVCVGVSYNGAPYYQSYCLNVTKCSGAREANEDIAWVENTSSSVLSYPNPFNDEVTIALPDGGLITKIEVYNTKGIMVHEASAVGAYKFGNNLNSGIYFVKIVGESNTETIKLVKE